eukprot:1181510-Amphidinium_carterae.1
MVIIMVIMKIIVIIMTSTIVMIVITIGNWTRKHSVYMRYSWLWTWHITRSALQHVAVQMNFALCAPVNEHGGVQNACERGHMCAWGIAMLKGRHHLLIALCCGFQPLVSSGSASGYALVADAGSTSTRMYLFHLGGAIIAVDWFTHDHPPPPNVIHECATF